MSEPRLYNGMGRNLLTAYCEELRTLIVKAAPLHWASTGDIKDAGEWECEALDLLNKHNKKGERNHE